MLVRHNTVTSPRLPAVFDGFTILHISDLHVDLSEDALRHLISFVGDLNRERAVDAAQQHQFARADRRGRGRALKLPRPLALDPRDVRLGERTRLRAPAPPRHCDPGDAIGVDLPPGSVSGH